ncbi:hypothetical protein OsccyDRAFT_1345 [Leptolyngbyaceae cyanobacterium JSC-12]|nr:hypothetical protein OsccyDRAFT_1345 [Leptolyngbyaceae cyanobacterium JSC-12]
MSEEQPHPPDPTRPDSAASNLPEDPSPEGTPSAVSPETPADAIDMAVEVAAQESAPADVAETEIAQPTPSPESATLPPTSAAQSQTLQKLQQVWQEAQPRLKAGTIRFLKATIQVLETAVARLEQEPATPEATSTSPSASPSSTLPNRVNHLGNLLQRGWQRFWTWWSPILPKIRDRLPASVNQALSDKALTGAIAGVLVLVLWTTSSLFSNRPPKQVAIAPPSQSAPAKPTPEKKVPKPKNLPEVKVIPPPKPTPSPSSSPSSASPIPSPSSTPTLSSPKFAPSPFPTPPSPPLKLTPEQKLIARIQDEVAEVSNQSVEGLIQSVQANFRASRLTVKVGERWYGLEPAQQDKLANDILKRAQQLNFVKLELTDPTGELLARSPAVGSEMIILKRAGKP